MTAAAPKGVVRTGIIGCGKIAPLHAKAFANLPESRFAAVCDGQVERAEAFAAEYGVPRVFSDPMEMLKSGEVDAVIVCTPHPSHADLVVAVAERGRPRHLRETGLDQPEGGRPDDRRRRRGRGQVRRHLPAPLLAGGPADAQGDRRRPDSAHPPWASALANSGARTPTSAPIPGGAPGRPRAAASS